MVNNGQKLKRLKFAINRKLKAHRIIKYIITIYGDCKYKLKKT